MADITTPLGFFSNTIQPVFNENIFSQENLGSEVQKPNLTSPLVLRDQITKAASDEDMSLTEFDASANLARQTLLSDLTNADVYTRSKRDLEFNINAERDVQLQQGRQLLADIDAFTESQRAIVQQREYEKELKRQEELLKEQKKEELEMIAMQLGKDPSGMSRKALKSLIAKAYSSKYSSSGGGRGGSSRVSSGSGSSGGYSVASSSGKCPTGYKKGVDGRCYPTDVVTYATQIRNYGQVPEGYYGPEIRKLSEDELANTFYSTGIYNPNQVRMGIDVYQGYYPQRSGSGGGSSSNSGIKINTEGSDGSNITMLPEKEN